MYGLLAYQKFQFHITCVDDIWFQIRIVKRGTLPSSWILVLSGNNVYRYTNMLFITLRSLKYLCFESNCKLYDVFINAEKH